jgi:hypothetical protein
MKGQKGDQHQQNKLSLAKADPSPGIAKCIPLQLVGYTITNSTKHIYMTSLDFSFF